MNTTLAKTNKTTLAPPTTKQNVNTSRGMVQRYLDFCDRQMPHRITWFLFPALVLPCLFMPIAIYFMLNYAGVGFSIYLFVAMLLFIGGMVATVGNLTTRVTVSLFFIAAFWNIAFPIVSILFLS